MGFLRRDDDDDQKQPAAPVNTAEAAEEAPHAAAYKAS